MNKLRASIDGCEIEVTIEDEGALTDDLRNALISVAEAMVSQQQADSDEVTGFSQLNLGALRMSPIKPIGNNVGSCWGFSETSGGAPDHCSWYSNDDGDYDPHSCTIYGKN